MKTAGYNEGAGTKLVPSKDVGVLPFQLEGIGLVEPLLRVCDEGELAGKAVVLTKELKWIIRKNELDEWVLIPRKKVKV
jgi:hypothetical protein